MILSSGDKKLFDGLACDDGNYITEFSSKKSYLSFKTQNFTEPIEEMTVEFWFKITNMVPLG